MSPHQTFWKDPPIKRRAERHDQKAKRRTALRNKKDDVRSRDRQCRFPQCGCRRLRMRTEVSHREHEGMGGNPAADRSDPDTMILVCSARHKESRISIDKETVRWEPLTARGADGPVRWEVDLREFRDFLEVQRDRIEPQWFEVARETGIGTWEPFLPMQLDILKQLARMDR